VLHWIGNLTPTYPRLPAKCLGMVYKSCYKKDRIIAKCREQGECWGVKHKTTQTIDSLGADHCPFLVSYSPVVWFVCGLVNSPLNGHNFRPLLASFPSTSFCLSSLDLFPNLLNTRYWNSVGCNPHLLVSASGSDISCRYFDCGYVYGWVVVWCNRKWWEKGCEPPLASWKN